MIWSTIQAYLFRVAVAGDDLANVAMDGMDGMTISARAGYARAAGKRWGCILCGILDWIQRDHCAKAMDNDIARARAVETYLQAKGKR